MRKTYKLVIVSLLICICALTVTACKPDENKNEKTRTATTGTTEVTFERSIAVIQSIDYANKKFELVNLETDMKFSLTSGVGVELTDKYGEHITVDQFKKGDIVRVKYEVESLKPISIAITAEIWEFKDVTGLSFDKEKKTVRNGSDLYLHTDNLMIIRDNEIVSSETISNVDKISIKGYKNQIWVIKVDSGHGTLILKNHEYFIDGLIDVGLGTSEIITEEFSIDVPVGVISLRIEQGSFFEEKEIMMERDKEYILDLAYLDSVVPKVGKVEFVFNQPAVTLYINGRVTAYDKQLDLPYGDYTIQAKKTGFEAYEEVFRVEEDSVKREIKLTPLATKEPAPVVTPKDPEVPVVTQTPKDTISISITKPSGAEIYIDGAFKGILPKEVELKSGNHNITLKKEGYNTTNYTIEIEKGMNPNFEFPELVLSQ